MAVTHIKFDRGAQFGGPVSSVLTQIEDGFNKLGRLFTALTLMIDGDGSDAAHFAYMQQMLGTSGEGGNADAKAIYERIGAALAKLGTDAQVSDVASTIQTAFGTLRQG